MKNLFTTLVLIMTLTACTSTLVKPVVPEQQVVTQTEYVIKLPPSALLTLPPVVPNINVDTAKQSDVAAWLLQKEEYTRSLENMLKGIAAFFNEQQTTLNQAAKSQDIQLQQAAAAAQAQEVADAAKKQVVTNVQPTK